MANEIDRRYSATGATLYMVRRKGGQVWNGSALVTQVNANWATYATQLDEIPTGGYQYKGSMTGLPAGFWTVDLFVQAGGGPAISDSLLTSGGIEWDGTAEVTLLDIPRDLTGIYTVTLQFYRTATTTPIPDVAADVYDSSETTRLNGAQLSSDVNGRATFGRGNGTYKIRAMLAGFTFTTGTVVVNGADITLIMYGAAAAADAPIPVGAIRVHDYCFLPDGITPMPTADVSGKMRIIELPYDYNGRLHSGKVVTGTYNVGTGKLYWDIAPGAFCEFFIRHAMPDGEPVEKRVPLTAAGNEIRLEDIP